MNSLYALILTLYFISAPLLILCEAKVVINEIAWMGSKVEGIDPRNWWRYEWLELYNPTENPICLEGYKIEFYRSQQDWVLELKGVIPAQGYFLIVSSDKISSNYDLNYSNLTGKLNNKGQKILLRNEVGEIIDEVDCSAGWFCGDNSTKQTMERKDPLIAGSDPNNWQSSNIPGGTPKAKNTPLSEQEKVLLDQQKPSLVDLQKPLSVDLSNTTTITYPSNVFINEIYPAPENSHLSPEWIEIFNQNDFEVDLKDWKISDIIGKTRTYTFSGETKILPKGFLLLLQTTTKISLNNQGDRLNLIQPDGKILHYVEYTKAQRGQSYNRGEYSWFWSSNLTPGTVNTLPTPISQPKQTKKSNPKSTSVEKIEEFEKKVIKDTPQKDYNAYPIQNSLQKLGYLEYLVSGVTITLLLIGILFKDTFIKFARALGKKIWMKK